MIVKDYILSLNVENLAEIITNKYLNENKEKASVDEVVKILKKTIKSIEKLHVNKHDNTVLHADKTFYEVEGYDYYDVYYSELDDEETNYSCLLVDWKDFLGYQLDESIDTTDIKIAGAIVWELTWHGWTYRKSRKHRNKMERELNSSIRKIKKEFGVVL